MLSLLDIGLETLCQSEKSLKAHLNFYDSNNVSSQDGLFPLENRVLQGDRTDGGPTITYDSGYIDAAP